MVMGEGGEDHMSQPQKKLPASYLLGFYLWGDQKVILWGKEDLLSLNSLNFPEFLTRRCIMK